MNTNGTDKSKYDEVFAKIAGRRQNGTGAGFSPRIGARVDTDDLMRRHVSSFACYFSLNALSIYAQTMMRSLVRAVRRSGDDIERRKAHYMQDYLSRGKRVPLLCGKITNLIDKYERMSLELMDQADRLNTNDRYDSYLFDEALEKESAKRYGPYMDEICMSFCELAISRLTPIDSIMFSECAKTLAACMIFERIYESTIKCIEKDTQKALGVIYEACDCVFEMLDEMRIEDHRLRHYRWLCSPYSRCEWAKAAIAGKRHIHGVKVTTIHPVNVMEMLETGHIGRIEFHLINEMFSLATIDEMIHNITGQSFGFSSRIGDFRIIHCIQNYHQYRISLSAMHGAYHEVLRQLDALPDDERREFVAAYKVTEKNTFDFLGCWVSHTWAHDDMGTDVRDIAEIARLNKAFEHGAEADIYADQNRIAYIGFEAFRNDVESVLRASKRNVEILSYKIEPIPA